MLGILTFVTGTVLTVVASLLVVEYLQKSLLKMLADICGTEERATFWRDIFNVSAVLAPMLIATNYLPTGVEKTGVFWETISIFKWGLSGLSLTIALLALVMNWHIGKAQATMATSKKTSNGA